MSRWFCFSLSGRCNHVAVLASVLYLTILGAGLTSEALAQITVTRTSSPVFYMDTAVTPALTGMYASYQITNNSGSDLEDAWVQLSGFTGGAVALAPAQSSTEQLGPLANGATKSAFFYLAASGASASAQSHTLTVYEGKPGFGGISQTSQGFSFSSASETQSANANKVTGITVSPNPSTLGGTFSVTVTGESGTIGGSNIMAFTPASFPDWPAGDFELVSTTITMTGGNNVTLTDDLYHLAASSSATSYTAVYTFRAVGIASANSSASPVGYIQSGNPMKHTNSTDFTNTSIYPPIQPAENQLTLSISVTPSGFLDGGTATFTITLTNAGASDAQIDDLVLTLPSSPATPGYVSSSSAYDGTSIDDPFASGTDHTWIGPFTVPAGSSKTLTFEVSIPATEGTYTHTVVGHIGTDQIDTTLDVSDDSPASADVMVYTDSDGDGIPDSVEDTNENGDPSDDDADQDGVPNYLDIDSDNDGLTDMTEAGDTPASPVNSDADAYPDYLDIDSDGDGVPDNVEAQPTASFTAPSASFTDIDSDGLDDAYDANTGSTDPTASAGLTPYDHDADGTPDYLDTDSDNDGNPDATEAHDSDHDHVPDRTPSNTDIDGDGLDDGYEIDANTDDIPDYQPGNTSNPNNGTADPAAEYPAHGDPGSDVNFRNELVLPVELTAFEAVADGSAVLLAWHTASETNNAGFEVQMRNEERDEDAWHMLAFVEGYGTTGRARSYTHRVAALEPGVYRFRLRQIDFDGTFAYSPDVEVAITLQHGLVVEPVYPNPFNPHATLRFAIRQEQAVQVTLYDVLGRNVRLLYAGTPRSGQMQTISIDGASLPSGLYLVRIAGERFVETQQVILHK